MRTLRFSQRLSSSWREHSPKKTYSKNCSEGRSNPCPCERQWCYPRLEWTIINLLGYFFYCFEYFLRIFKTRICQWARTWGFGACPDTAILWHPFGAKNRPNMHFLDLGKTHWGHHRSIWFIAPTPHIRMCLLTLYKKAFHH